MDDRQRPRWLKAWVVGLAAGFFCAPLPAAQSPTTGPGIRATAEVQPAPASPVETVRAISDQLAVLLRTQRARLLLEPAFLRAQVHRLLEKHLAYDGLAQRILGPHWRTASPEQRAAFSAEFRRMLERSAAATAPLALGLLEEWELRFAPMPPVTEAEQAAVRFEVQTRRGKLEMEAHLQRAGRGWRVLDVAVNGIGLSDLYRRSFRGRAQREGMAGLTSALETWNRQREGAS